MKVNQNTVLIGEKVVLVPYRPEHVPVCPSTTVSLILWISANFTSIEIPRLDARSRTPASHCKRTFESRRRVSDAAYALLPILRATFDLIDATGQWLQDDDKLTFIILAAPNNLEESHSPSSGLLPDQELSPTDACVSALPMIGDVNVFLKGSMPSLSNHLDFQNPQDGDGEDDDIFEAEVEIMIAGEFQCIKEVVSFSRSLTHGQCRTCLSPSGMCF
jgi:hypothetical protein